MQFLRGRGAFREIRTTWQLRREGRKGAIHADHQVYPLSALTEDRAPRPQALKFPHELQENAGVEDHRFRAVVPVEERDARGVNCGEEEQADRDELLHCA